MTNKLNNNEKGFALPLTLLLLVVMTIMGATLITVITGEHKANTDKDTNQQVFYAAESGIAIAKKWMETETSTLESASATARDGSLKFCKTTLFPNLKNNSNSFHASENTLSNVITGASREEKERLGKYSFEYFITYSPNASGVPTIKTKTVASTEGSSVTQGTAYKSTTTTSAIYYTIYSCGCDNTVASCNAQNNIIIPLEAVVTLVKK
jgi:type IV pilus assembly protein PilX